jgi:DNA-binding MarR family transcriptional regulator
VPTKLQQDQFTYLIAKVHRFVHNKLEARLQKEGVSVEQWRVLEELGSQSGRSMGELANTVLMNHPALTKMLDRMVSVGLVHRAADPEDQRRVLVYISDRGLVLLERLRPKVRAHEEAIAEILGKSNIGGLTALLENASSMAMENA